MCSVQGCESSRRTPRFRLPEDPEVRLEWVQFLAAVNQQCFRESSWTDITVCSQHFRPDCLLYAAPAGSVQLTPGAVPSVGCPPPPPPLPPERAVPPPPEDDGMLATTDPTASSARLSPDESVGTNQTDELNEAVAAAQDSDDDWDPDPRGRHERDEDEEEDDSEDEEERYAYSSYTTHCKLCAECGKFFRNRWPHTCEHKRRPFSCNICGKRFVNELALLNHNRIHTDDYVHRCKYCNRTFKVKVEKLSHEQVHVTEGEPYRCPECPETFATNKERRNHLKKDHKDPEDLKCHICGIQFLWALSVQRHMAVHTGLRPYKCSVCQRGFNQAGHLKSHMRLHTGERPFKCEHCGQRFNHNVSLKSHLQRYHTSGSENVTAKRKRDRDKADPAQWNNSETDNVAEGQETETTPGGGFKKKRRSTGRPRGRPKSYASDDVVVAIQLEQPCPKSKAGKRKARKRRWTKRSNEDSDEEAEPTLSDFEERVDVADNNDDDSDSDFDPSRLK